MVGRAVGSRGGISCKLSQGPPITPSSLQLSLVWIHLHNLVQYLLSQPHFLGCLHGRQLGRLQLQHYRHAGKPRQAHTERQLPNKHSPRGAPAWVYPRPCSWSSAGPHLKPTGKTASHVQRFWIPGGKQDRPPNGLPSSGRFSERPTTRPFARVLLAPLSPSLAPFCILEGLPWKGAFPCLSRLSVSWASGRRPQEQAADRKSVV